MLGIYSFIISCFIIIGNIGIAENFPASKKELFILPLKFEAYFVCILAITIIILQNIPKAINKIKNIKEHKFFTDNKKSFLITFIMIFLAYIPYILNYYPGIVLTDSIVQILQGQGVFELTNHHPALHTLIIEICMNIGKNIFNNYQTGAFIYTLLQTLATAMIFSFTIYYMAKKRIPVIFRIVALLFYMFCPNICFYTITMYKDIPFALMILLVTIGITELTTNTENFMKSKKRIMYLMILITLAMLFRNNGLYAIILTLPFMLLTFRKYYKQILIIFLLPIIIYKIIVGPIYNIIGVEKGSSREALSIPIQQFARLMSYRNDELTEKQKEKIKQYLPIENFKELYNPFFADPIKSNFSEEGYEKDKSGLIKLYVELAIKFPTQTLMSFIKGSLGYYYPNTVGWGVYTVVQTDDFDGYEEYKFKQEPIIKINSIDKINEFVNTRNLPIVSMCISIGFLFWMILFAITYLAYKKEYKKIVIFLPVIFIWFTVLASPVFCEPRYVYSIFTCLPLFIGIAIKDDYNIKNKGE